MDSSLRFYVSAQAAMLLKLKNSFSEFNRKFVSHKTVEKTVYTDTV